MANEITMTNTIQIANGYAAISRGTSTGIQIDQTGKRFIHNRQNIGTSEEALALGDVSTPGCYWIKNLDATNYVEIRPGSGEEDLLKLLPGEEACGRFAADATPYAIADTASVDVEYIIAEA